MPMKLDPSEIEIRFSYHAPKNDQPARYERIRNEAKAFARTLYELCTDCRESSLALTHLDEVVMWANAAIARRE